MSGFAFACLTMMALQFPPIPVDEIFDSCYPRKVDCNPVTISTRNSTSTKIVTESTTESSNITTIFSFNSTNSTTASTSTLSTRSTESYSSKTTGSVSSTTVNKTLTTTPSTFTTSPSPPLPPIAVNISECGCDVPNLYLDVMFVVSTANDLSHGDVQAIEFYLESVILEMTLGQGIQQVTRIGLVVYSDSAQLVFPLSSFNNTDDFFANFNIPIPASPMNRNNLYEGLFLAKAELDNNVRQGFQPVIVIITQTFDPIVDPSKIAASFRRYGRIITIQYFAEHGTDADLIPQITELASTNYNLSNRNRTLHVSQLHDLFCEANCYCPAYWQIYKRDHFESPTMGCYKMAADNRFVTYSEAQRTCRSDNGALVSLEDLEKANWIQTMEHDIYAQWIGLVCHRGNCTWDDLTKFNFDLFDTLNANDGQLCTVQADDQTQKLAWNLVSCSTQFQNFTCERRACASDYFCINSNSQFLQLPYL